MTGLLALLAAVGWAAAAFLFGVILEHEEGHDRGLWSKP